MNNINKIIKSIYNCTKTTKNKALMIANVIGCNESYVPKSLRGYIKTTKSESGVTVAKQNVFICDECDCENYKEAKIKTEK